MRRLGRWVGAVLPGTGVAFAGVVAGAVPFAASAIVWGLAGLSLRTDSVALREPGAPGLALTSISQESAGSRALAEQRSAVIVKSAASSPPTTTRLT